MLRQLGVWFTDVALECGNWRWCWWLRRRIDLADVRAAQRIVLCGSFMGTVFHGCSDDSLVLGRLSLVRARVDPWLLWLTLARGRGDPVLFVLSRLAGRL